MYGGDAYSDTWKIFLLKIIDDIVDKVSSLSSGNWHLIIFGVFVMKICIPKDLIMNKEAQLASFLNHIMTVSNHRPFTAPNGIAGDAKSRTGVKYTDYAMKKILINAKKQPGLIIQACNSADHCASRRKN
jgi:phosphoglycerol transferase MdoB-like AlkP superfamily enzyme